jgi:Protein of unknown function (DUF2778)
MANETTLLFNGNTLLIAENGVSYDAFNAVSGRPNVLSDPKYQNVPDMGTIPEGTYTLGPVQYSSDFDALLGLASGPLHKFGLRKIGGWSGGPIAWGWERIELIPDSSTDTFGRSGFTIHGGWYPGSAGCIDLNASMPTLAKIMQKLGPGAKLIVKYEPTPRCFTGDTSIMTADGLRKSIKDIKVGDVVMSFDPAADGGRGALVPKRVKRLFRNTTREWIKLTWLENGEDKELVATPGHHMLDITGAFTRLDLMVQNGKAEVVLASGEVVEAKADRITYSAETAHLFERATSESEFALSGAIGLIN